MIYSQLVLPPPSIAGRSSYRSARVVSLHSCYVFSFDVFQGLCFSHAELFAFLQLSCGRIAIATSEIIGCTTLVYRAGWSFAFPTFGSSSARCIQPNVCSFLQSNGSIPITTTNNSNGKSTSYDLEVVEKLRMSYSTVVPVFVLVHILAVSFKNCTQVFLN